MVLITNFPTEGSRKLGAFYLKIEDSSQWFEKFHNLFLFKGSFWTTQEEKIIESIRNSSQSEVTKSLESMNAIFGLIRVDDQGNDLTFANDRYGFKSIYCYWNPQTHRFAISDSYLIIQESIQPFGLKADVVGIAEFLLFNFPLNGKTFTEGIHRIPMGSFGIFREGKMSLDSYWTPSSISPSTTDLDKAVREVDNLLNTATDLILLEHDSEEIALGLSGGMDSRLVAAKFVERGVRPNCFVYGTKRSDSFRVANEVATQLGLRLRLIEIDPHFYRNVCKDAITVSPMINLLTSWPLALKGKMPHFDVLLTGFNGDNIFGSHIQPTSLSLPHGDVDSTIEQILTKYGQNGTISDIQQIMIPSITKQITLSLRQFVNDNKSYAPWRIIEEFNFSNRQLAFIKSDFMFQSTGSKWISPFMYPPFVDYLNGLDVSLKFNLRLFREYMNRFYPELFQIRTERSAASNQSNVLKKSILNLVLLFERLMGTNYLSGESHKKFLLDLTHSMEFYHYAQEEFSTANMMFRQTIDVNKAMLLLNDMTFSRRWTPRKVPSSQFRKLLRIFAALTTKFWFDSLTIG